MPEVRYFKDNKPVKVEWVRNEETNELQLFLDGKKEPAKIELRKSALSGGYIIAKHNATVIGTAHPFELGSLKKRVLEQVYRIRFKYLEV